MFSDIINSKQDPIQTSDEDKLNRGHFVNYASSIIKNAPVKDKSFVLSINGKWGSGKTSIKNLIIEKFIDIQKVNKNILLEFNSLEFQTQKELNKIFLDKVLKVIKGKNNANKFLNFLKENRKNISITILTILFLFLTFFSKKSGKFFLISVISTMLSSFLLGFRNQLGKLSISTMMDVVSKSYLKIDVVQKILYYDELKTSDIENLKLRKLIETKCPYDKIIIFIDNFDSLEPNQIKMLIQLINKNLNLPKIVFVLFFDKYIVGNSLTTNAYSGFEFIEQFINIKLDIPTITDEILFNFLQNELQEKYNINIELEENFKYVKNYFSSLNKIYSFLDNFGLNYTLVSKSLKYNKFSFNKNDFLFLEIIRFFENDLYRIIRKNKRLLTKNSLTLQDENDKVWPLIKNSIANNSEENIKNLLLDLFPYLSIELGIKNKYNEELLKNSKSVGYFDYFEYYFIYDLNENIISENSFNVLKEYLLNNTEFTNQFKLFFSIKHDNMLHFAACGFLYKIYKRTEDLNILKNTTELEEIEFLKNLLWLYIYSKRNIVTKKYITSILYKYCKSQENFIDRLIKSLQTLLDSKDYFYYFYIIEFLIIIENSVIDILFKQNKSQVEQYEDIIDKIIFKYVNLLIENDELLNYLSKDNFNSKLQLHHLIIFFKNRVFLKNSNSTNNAIVDNIVRLINSEKFIKFKNKLFKDYFNILYFFVEYCIKKKIVSNSLRMFLEPDILYPFEIKEIIEAFKEKKVSKKDKVFNTLLNTLEIKKY